jgi:hypothetical protein
LDTILSVVKEVEPDRQRLASVETKSSEVPKRNGHGL